MLDFNTIELLHTKKIHRHYTTAQRSLNELREMFPTLRRTVGWPKQSHNLSVFIFFSWSYFKEKKFKDCRFTHGLGTGLMKK